MCACKRERERERERARGEVMASVFESVSERRDGTQQNINSEKIKKSDKIKKFLKCVKNFFADKN